MSWQYLQKSLAEGILQHKAKIAGLNWQVESAGTTSYHAGDEPHYHSKKWRGSTGLILVTNVHGNLRRKTW